MGWFNHDLGWLPTRVLSVTVSSAPGHATDRVDLPAIVQPKRLVRVRLSAADRTQTKQK